MRTRRKHDGPARSSQPQEAITLEEWCRLRSRIKRLSLCFFLCMILGTTLAAGLRSLAIAGMAFGGLLLSASLLMRWQKRMEDFRCPQCGKDPTIVIVAPDDPTDDRVYSEFYPDFCLHCDKWLG
ncbi:MAG: hypothetical protein QM581_02360 [Pseudomonas sp.]